MNKIINFKNIKKSFGSLNVIDDISFDVEAGKIYCVLGASGCGKSTFLDIASGINKEFEGRVISDLKIPGKDLGYMVQTDSLLPWRNVKDNIKLASELLKIDIAEDEIFKIIKTIKLDGFEDYFPKELSGGQKQRIALARTLSYKPKLILLDEPLGNLDIVVRKELAFLVKNYVQENNSSAVVITHSVSEAIYLADELFVLTSRPSKIYKHFSLSDEKNNEKLYRDEAFSAVNESLEKAILIGEFSDEK